MGKVAEERTGRINMRVNERQERVLRAAADLTGETVHARRCDGTAEEALARAQRIEVSAEAFRRFVAAIEAPVEDMATLRRYARKSSPIPAR